MQRSSACASSAGAGAEDPYEDERDGLSFAPLLRNKAAQNDPDAFRIGVIIEKQDKPKRSGKGRR